MRLALWPERRKLSASPSFLDAMSGSNGSHAVPTQRKEPPQRAVVTHLPQSIVAFINNTAGQAALSKGYGKDPAV